MTDALEDPEGNVSIWGRTITNLRFADDIDDICLRGWWGLLMGSSGTTEGCLSWEVWWLRTGSTVLAILLSARSCCRVSWERWLHPLHRLWPVLLGCCRLQRRGRRTGKIRWVSRESLHSLRHGNQCWEDLADDKQHQWHQLRDKRKWTEAWDSHKLQVPKLSYNWWGFQAWDTLRDSTDNSSTDKVEASLEW